MEHDSNMIVECKITNIDNTLAEIMFDYNIPLSVEYVETNILSKLYNGIRNSTKETIMLSSQNG